MYKVWLVVLLAGILWHINLHANYLHTYIKAAELDEIPPEIWKTRQFDDTLFWQCNAVYNQNPIDTRTKGCILSFPKKGDLKLTENYQGITFTSIVAIEPHRTQNWEDPKNQNGFRKTRSTKSQILNIRRILEGVRAKTLDTTILFVDFTKAFDSIYRGEMEKIQSTQRNRRSHNDAI